MISSTTIVKRYGEGLLREACDATSNLVVTTFQADRAAEAIPLARLDTPGAYVLVGKGSVYPGESRNVANRIRVHLADPTKSFVAECFAVSRPGVAPFEKEDVRYLEHVLTGHIREADILALACRQDPHCALLPDWRKAVLDRSMDTIIRLFRDAGCPAFIGAAAPRDPAPDTDDDQDPGSMEVGVSTVPLGVQEFELAYLGMWARGYSLEGRFIVCAGSEIRIKENPSIIDKIRSRRERLLQDDLSSAISGVTDRRRLTGAVAFDTMPVAAKTISGAHLGTDKWVPLTGSTSAFVAG